MDVRKFGLFIKYLGLALGIAAMFILKTGHDAINEVKSESAAKGALWLEQALKGDRAASAYERRVLDKREKAGEENIKLGWYLASGSAVIFFIGIALIASAKPNSSRRLGA